MWGDAGPDRHRTGLRRVRSLAVDLALVALLPGLLAGGLAAAVGIDRWRERDDTMSRRDHLVAIDDLLELRGLVAREELVLVARSTGEAGGDPADEGLDVAIGFDDSAAAIRASLAPVVDQLAELDVDRLTGRPGSLTSMLEGLAELGGVSAPVGVGPMDAVRTRHDVVSDRIDALVVELIDAPVLRSRAEPALVRALSNAEVLAVENAANTIDSSTALEGTAAAGDGAGLAAARLDDVVARLRAELPAADARRLTADLLNASAGGIAARTTSPERLAVAAARVDQIRALRRDFAAAQVADTTGEVDRLTAELRTGALVALAALAGIGFAVVVVAGRVLGGLGALDARLRRALAGEPDPPHDSNASDGLEPVRGRELLELSGVIDELSGAMRGVEDSVRSLADDTATAPDPATIPGRWGASVVTSVAGARGRTEMVREREAFARALIDTTDEAIFTIDERSLVAWANAAAARMFALPIDDLVGARVGDLVGRLPLLGDLPVGITNADATVVAASGAASSVLVSTRLLGDDDHPTVAVFARDISERRELEHQLSHQATHDDLTGLGNRASLVSELDRARARAQRSGQGFGLLFIDLDRFKLVNDTLGHRTGDLVLRQIADRLRSATRDTDFIARNGGDEFVVIAEEATDIATVVRLADRIQEELAIPLVIEDDAIPVSASIGVTWLDPEDANSLDQLRNADVAMYQAKSSGPGQVRVFDEDMRNWVEQRFDLERSLRRAVGRGELDAFVQPIIDLRTGRVTGVELLSRWTLEDGREIPPDAFIEVAEDSTLVVEIGRWVLDRAASLISEWDREPRLAGLTLSVNISGRHVDHPNVVADVSDALHRWNADPRRLSLEITETSLLRDLTEAAATLRELRDVGVSISVDDFGVGYASLRYLRELPVELVKIDRSIVAGFERNDSDTVIVTMLTRLADVLDIGIVAEGVETEEQRERLADIGCHFAQGFLFAPAMPVPEFQLWMARWERQHTHPAQWHMLAHD